MKCVEYMGLFPSFQMFFSVIRPPGFTSRCPSKVGFYPHTETGRTSVLCPLHTFQSGSPVLKKDNLWVVKLARGWKKIYIHFKGAKKECTISHLLK